MKLAFVEGDDAVCMVAHLDSEGIFEKQLELFFGDQKMSVYHETKFQG